MPLRTTRATCDYPKACECSLYVMSTLVEYPFQIEDNSLRSFKVYRGDLTLQGKTNSFFLCFSHTITC